MRITMIVSLMFFTVSTALAVTPAPIQPVDPIKSFNLSQCLDEGMIPKDQCYHAYYVTKKCKKLMKDGECSTLYGIQ